VLKKVRIRSSRCDEGDSERVAYDRTKRRIEGGDVITLKRGRTESEYK